MTDCTIAQQSTGTVNLERESVSEKFYYFICLDIVNTEIADNVRQFKSASSN